MRLAILSLALLGLTALASADITIDNPARGTGGAGFGSQTFSTASIGQSFFAPTGATALKEFTFTTAGVGSGVFQIYELFGTQLGDSLYRSQFFSLGNNLTSRTFTPNVAVTPGFSYIALVTSTSGNIRGATGGGYADGSPYYRDGNGPLVLFSNAGSFAFRATFASVQATPEPFTLALGAAGLGVALRRRRRG